MAVPAICFDFDNDKESCQATDGCLYDDLDGYCDYASGADSICYDYDDDSQDCLAAAGCSYDAISAYCDPN